MDNLRPLWAHHSLDYNILGNADTLRQMVESGLTDAQIGEMAECHENTVAIKRLAFGIRRANCKVAAKSRKQREPTSCKHSCPGWDDCLDDDRPCTQIRTT